MDRQRLFSEIVAARPASGDLIYIERRGEEYAWSRTAEGSAVAGAHTGSALPDAWIYYSGPLPLDEPDRLQALFDDLLAEMDSMAAAGDRCRWPLDQPYPHGH